MINVVYKVFWMWKLWISVCAKYTNETPCLRSQAKGSCDQLAPANRSLLLAYQRSCLLTLYDLQQITFLIHVENYDG